MRESIAFSAICEKLQADTSLDQLEARGTIRIALKQAGLDARTVTPDHMLAILDSVLPKELSIRGIEDGDRLCARWKIHIRALEYEAPADSPEAVFDRLGGRPGE